MPTTVAQVQAEVSADISPLKRSMSEAGEETKKTGGFFDKLTGGLGKLVGGGMMVTGALTAAGVAIMGLADAGAEADANQKMLDATLANVGAKTGITSKQVGDLADKLALIAPYSDEDITALDTMLARVDGMNSKELPEATQTTLDLASAMHQNLTTAAKQVSKILDDPAKALSKLHKYNVDLTAAQQASIKSFLAQGDKADAQKVILDALEAKYKGTAAAAGQTLPGAMERLNTQFDQVKQKIGLAIIPGLISVFNAIIPVVNVIQTQFGPILANLAGLIAGKVAPIIVILAGFLMKNLVPAAIQIGAWLGQHVVPILIQVGSVVEKNILPTLGSMFGVIMTSLVPAIQRLWEKLSPLLIPVLNLVGFLLKNVVGPAFGFVVPIIGGIIDVISTLIDWIGKLIDGFGRMANAVGGAMKGVGNFLHNIPGVGNFLPHFAGGTSNAPGGVAMVGEQGPELVYLPRGSRVIPNNQLRGSVNAPAPMQGGPIYLVLNNQIIGQALWPALHDSAMQAMGVHT